MKLKLAALILLATLTACGGGGGDEAGPAINGDNPGGVWSGTITGASAADAAGAITQAGEGYFWDSAGNVYRIRGGSVSGNDFTAAVTVMQNNLDGSSTVQTGRFTGAIVEGVSLTGTYNIAGATGTFDFDYNASSYETPSSLDDIAGAYNFSVPTDSGSITLTVRIANTGAITVDQIPGCSGTLGIPFADYATVRYTLSGGCGASNITGFGFYVPGDELLTMELDDGATFSAYSFATKGSSGGGGSTAGGATTGGSTAGGTTGGVLGGVLGMSEEDNLNDGGSGRIPA